MDEAILALFITAIIATLVWGVYELVLLWGWIVIPIALAFIGVWALITYLLKRC